MYAKPPPTVPQWLRSNILKVFSKHGEIPENEFQKLYTDTTNVPLDLQENGFLSMRQLMEQLLEVCISSERDGSMTVFSKSQTSFDQEYAEYQVPKIPHIIYFLSF